MIVVSSQKGVEEYDIVVKVAFGHPLVYKGNFSTGGLGPPNPSQKLNAKPETSPASAPCN